MYPALYSESMAAEPGHRSRLEFPGSAESTCERAIDAVLNGQSTRQWIEHQRDGLGAGTQEALQAFAQAIVEVDGY